MRILCCLWETSNIDDLVECLQITENQVDCFYYPIKDLLNDIVYAKKMQQILKEKTYDCIFTFDFLPIVSKVAYAYDIIYISWVFDSPNLTLYSKAVFNECNYIFSFDKLEVSKLKEYGVEHIYHMPLAVNTKRLEQTLLKERVSYQYEVSFLGNLYNNQYNFFDQIKYLPDYYKGFFDALVKTQLQIWGCDVASEVITTNLYKSIEKFVPIDLDQEIFIDKKDIFINFIQKKVTVEERPEILRKVSEKYHLAHFAEEQDMTLTKVDFKGYADYRKEMPVVFAGSKINLNITLRTILSGIPLRCMDIMGAGGFLLSNYQPELDEYFVNGQEMVMFESQDDLLGKIEYYLTHEKEREEIAMCGQAKIQNEFCYEKKLKEIFSIVYEKSNM